MDHLKKALDKARKERPQPLSAPAADRAVLGSGNGSGRVSPTYCRSRCLELEPEKLAENRCVCLFADAPETESFKVLSTRLLLSLRRNGCNTLMITSALPGEGKTLTAINLALALAREVSQTVLLVDCDLRQQKIHHYLGMQIDSGLGDYLLQERPLEELIVWPGVERFTFISGGRTVQESAELIGSPRMKALVAEMKSRYHDRYILFDVPPLLGSADALTFAPLVDAIIMLVEAEQTSIHTVLEAFELIPRDKFLGFVLNRYKAPLPGYGKEYGRR
ncbi:MAG: AAA family ATPase [Deltaproteobacteria bacterium]|nr:AAA family ATPase [Deltaproteobacteria bacterium]